MAKTAITLYLQRRLGLTHLTLQTLGVLRVSCGAAVYSNGDPTPLQRLYLGVPTYIVIFTSWAFIQRRRMVTADRLPNLRPLVMSWGLVSSPFSAFG
jgi:hypothetical protein